jgi:hypothetical protein
MCSNWAWVRSLNKMNLVRDGMIWSGAIVKIGGTILGFKISLNFVE